MNSKSLVSKYFVLSDTECEGFEDHLDAFDYCELLNDEHRGVYQSLADGKKLRAVNVWGNKFTKEHFEMLSKHKEQFEFISI